MLGSAKIKISIIESKLRYKPDFQRIVENTNAVSHISITQVLIRKISFRFRHTIEF